MEGKANNLNGGGQFANDAVNSSRFSTQSQHSKICDGIPASGCGRPRESLHFGFLTCHPQPKGISAKINLIIPDQFANFADPSLSKVFVIVPKGKNSGARLRRKIDFAFRAVIKAQQETVVIENF
jgi:hypothetical protein